MIHVKKKKKNWQFEITESLFIQQIPHVFTHRKFIWATWTVLIFQVNDVVQRTFFVYLQKQMLTFVNSH